MEWRTAQEPVTYPDALNFMEKRVADIASAESDECIYLLEHPPLYTAGTSADEADLVDPERFPVYQAGRGGQFTYHGPGQRVAYTMLDLKERMSGKPDIRRFVWLLEEWIIRTLKHFSVQGERREGRVGIWVVADDGIREDKIAALGIRVRKWVSFHGIAINVHPDLSHFSGIVPCGIRQHGVTSLHALGRDVTMQEVDEVLKREFEKLEWSNAIDSEKQRASHAE